MTSVRDQLASEVKIGKVSFFATSASGPGAPRRIAQYTGVGVDGAVTEDLGADAHVETLTATIHENQYIDLKNIKDAGKVVNVIHPLFGILSARLSQIEYQANPNDMVDVTITLIEHGEPQILLTKNVLDLNSAAQNAKSAFDDLGLDDLDGLATPDLSASIASMESTWTEFDAVLDLALAGDALFDDVAAGFNDIAKAGQELIDAVDTAYNDISSIVDFPIQDTIYELIDAGRDVVNSMERQAGEVWQNVKAIGSVSIAELALEYLGSDTDEAIQQILDRNPQIIDVSALVPGTELSIPV